MVSLLSIVLTIGEISAVFLLFLYLFYQYKFGYWKRRGVPSLPATFPFGSFGQIGGGSFKKPIGVVMQELYFQSKQFAYAGAYFFFRPVLFVNDPQLIKHIFVKDFNSFQDRGVHVDEERDPLGAHLFSIGGQAWRYLRVKLSPTFTSGKMKMMYHILLEKSNELVKCLDGPAKNGEIVDVKEMLARFTTDIISSCAFGVEANSLSDPNSEFRVAGRKIFTATKLQSVMRGFIFVFPALAKLFKVKFVTDEVEKFFMGAVRDTTEYRRKNNIQRKDFLQLLMQLQDQGYIEDVDKENETFELKEHASKEKFTFNQVAAQAFLFFIGGFETSSTTSQFLLYELALHPDIQEKTREEVDRVVKQHNGQMTYECILEMKYLDSVVQEAMRKYPALPGLQRECNRTYKIPDSDTVIEKGTLIFISTYGLHMDPNYFPQPERFDPERFNEENRSKIPQYVHMPFGDGPRNCIGMRFGMMQTKLGIASLLSKYKFEVCKNTQIPIVLDPTQFVLTPLGGKLELKITQRT